MFDTIWNGKKLSQARFDRKKFLERSIHFLLEIAPEKEVLLFKIENKTWRLTYLSFENFV